MPAMATQQLSARALTPADLAEVVAIDAYSEGRPRRQYVERRLAAALRDPKQHAQFAVGDDKGLAGYILARVLEGEFGRDLRSLRLEMVGVRHDARGHGVGKALFDALTSWARRHDVRELRTAASWRDATMLHWLDGMGFELATAAIVDCSVDGASILAQRDDAIDDSPGGDSGREIDFSAAPENDYERVERDRADVCSMRAADLADIVRIDRGITGRDRGAYMQAKLGEALDDGGLRVSLVARRDGVNVGYLMANVDRGDFGRTEPVAVIDTLGVDPAYARHGVGRALLSQLYANLGALHVERVETIVPMGDLQLLGFLFAAGFAPAQRLPFMYRLQ